MRKALGLVCMLVGLGMLMRAGWYLYENVEAEREAARQAAGLLAQLKDEVGAAAVTLVPPEAAPVPAQTPVPEMPTKLVNGQECIGYLELPTLDISLPIISEWSYSRLEKAPCRYWGNVYDGTLVILAHNYTRHFGKIKDMEIGAPVQFVDMAGNLFQYTVAEHEILERDEVEAMVNSEYDLTLFTCTYGGRDRVTVRLREVRSLP